MREVVCGTVWLVFNTHTGDVVWASLSEDDAKTWEAEKQFGRYEVEPRKLMGYGK